MATAPSRSAELAAIQEKHEQVEQEEYLLESKDPDGTNKTGTMNQ